MAKFKAIYTQKKPLHLFIDTNVYLAFFHYNKDDLDELRKLKILVEKEVIILYVTEQVINELNRNRENKIVDALKVLKDLKVSTNLPQIARSFDKSKELLGAIKQFEKVKNELLDEILSNARANELESDKVLFELFGAIDIFDIDDDIIDKARDRFDLGNPPGKDKSYGDAVNWEILLNAVPHRSRFAFVSSDSDFSSILDKTRFHPFLMDEWRDHKNIPLKYYKNLTSLFKENFPDIQLNGELEKNHTIDLLASADSYANAKNILSQLGRFDDFDQEQLNRIIISSLANNQVYWIANDWGVGNVLHDIIGGKEDLIDVDLLKEFKENFKPWE